MAGRIGMGTAGYIPACECASELRNEVRLKPTKRACDYGGTGKNHTMRFLIVAVAVSALAFASGAFAQTAPQSSPAPASGGRGEA